MDTSASRPPDPYGLTAAHWHALETQAALGGWQGARAAGCRDVTLTDAIVKAALAAVRARLELWHSQDPQRHLATLPDPSPDPA